MGKVLSTWRFLPLYLFMMILPVCAYTFMDHSGFADMAQKSWEAISSIESSYIQDQMTTAIAMRHFLPKGIIGMMAAFTSTHDTYLHSWELGRFLQPDPVCYYDSMNLYQYRLNNPVNWRDPFGLYEWDTGDFVGTIGGGAIIGGLTGGSVSVGGLVLPGYVAGAILGGIGYIGGWAISVGWDWFFGDPDEDGGGGCSSGGGGGDDGGWGGGWSW